MAKKNKDDKYTLTSPMGMGGIHGGEGFTYQDRYIACHISHWLNDPDFVRLMPEGTGDVDVVFEKDGKDQYEHIQIKDHLVATKEFKEVIESFVKIDGGTEKIYRKFTLSCPGFGQDVSALINKLERFKGAADFIDDANKKGLSSTETDVKAAITKLGLKSHYNFILEKVVFEQSPLDFSNDSACESFFGGNLLKHSLYKKIVSEIVNTAYNKILLKVISHKGKPLLLKDLTDEIESIISSLTPISEDIVMHVHNWTNERFDPNPSHTVDWTTHFDRETKKVPDFSVWNTELIPELQKIKKELLTNTTARHIIFRGKCCLSTGLALGMVFPETGGWSFEIIQPGQPQAWKSNETKINEYKIKHEVLDSAALGIPVSETENAVVFNVTGTAQEEVIQFLKDSGIALKKMLLIQLENSPGSFSIQSNAEAVSVATVSKDVIKRMLINHTATKTHLFFYGPMALALFLGQKLTSVGSIQLYEYQQPGYKPSCNIKT
jgi:hypothetical protein